jgi:hypothetical protein
MMHGVLLDFIEPCYITLLVASSDNSCGRYDSKSEDLTLGVHR